MGDDNNSPSGTENVHNMMSGTLGQWIRKEKKCMYFSTYTQHMGQDNNSPPKNVMI